jgi:hypothetical protein
MRASVTRAAEGFDRRCFAVKEVLGMQDAGLAWRQTSGTEGESWTSVVGRGPQEALVCARSPGFAIRLAEV